jgi:DNA-binding transcriptional ArsR family regulator
MVQPSDGDIPAALDQRLMRALEHPVRVGFLKLLASEDSLSPAQALKLLDRDDLALSNIAYHVRVLDQVDLVEPTGEPDQKGTVAFRPTSKGETALEVLGLS